MNIEPCWQLTIETVSEAEESIREKLDELGCLGTSVEYQNAYMINMHSYFAIDQNMREVRKSLLVFFGVLRRNKIEIGAEKIYWDELKAADWTEKWKESIKPVKISSNLLIAPSWEDVEDDSSVKVVRIDPQMAFGTGAHSTTKYCLTLIDELRDKAKTLIDIGSGSGILSIAAAMLGYESVTAVECDSVAIETAKENFIRNDVQNKIHLIADSVESLNIDQTYDLVVANLTTDLLTTNAAIISGVCNKGGHVVASGIYEKQHGKFLRTFFSQRLTLIKQFEQNHWFTMVFSKY